MQVTLKKPLRLLVLVTGSAVIGALWHLPSWLHWTEAQGVSWLVALQLAGPAFAAACSAFAAVCSDHREKQAWTFISLASLLYIAGNLGYILNAFSGQPDTFPQLADAAFFLMALLFGVAIWRYTKRVSLPASINAYNFILLYGSMVFGTLFLLHHQIKASRLEELGTIVAFLYPALWGSVAALSILLLILYPKGARRWPALLLTLAISVEAVADLIYATELMSGSHEPGGWPHLMWMISASFIAWAAIEHILQRRQPTPVENDLLEPRITSPMHLIGQSLAPALILLIILATGTIAGAFGRGVYQQLAAVLTIIVAVTVGLREFRVESTRRQLHAVAEKRLSELRRGEELLASVLESTSDSVLVIDSEWRIQFFNDHALRFIPELRSVGIRGSFWDLFRPNERETYGSLFETVLGKGEPLGLRSVICRAWRCFP